MTTISRETPSDHERPSAVVVGVDGSDEARSALRWALAEARLRKAPLRLVHVWTHVGAGGTKFGVETGDPPRQAEDLIEREIGNAGETEGIKLERRVVEGNAADALVAEVSDGDLLVVGSRGHGVLAGALLGSVSQRCVRHAPCPVVVVRSETTE
jgi:nucleotide-binding universal stress UspA family protein